MAGFLAGMFVGGLVIGGVAYLDGVEDGEIDGWNKQRQRERDQAFALEMEKAKDAHQREMKRLEGILEQAKAGHVEAKKRYLEVETEYLRVRKAEEERVAAMSAEELATHKRALEIEALRKQRDESYQAALRSVTDGRETVERIESSFDRLMRNLPDGAEAIRITPAPEPREERRRSSRRGRSTISLDGLLGGMVLGAALAED